MLDALDPDCKMVLRPLIAVDDQYIVRIAVAMQLVQYLLTTESQPGEALCGSDSTGVVGVWQNLRNWTLGCVTWSHTHTYTLVLGGIDIYSDGYLSKIQHGYHGIIH